MTTTIAAVRQTDETQVYAAGEVIFRAGEPGALMYVVKSGKVDISLGGELIDSVGAGGIIGEMAIISDEPRVATAIARTDCVLTPIDQRRFELLVQETPYFAIMVMRVLAERLRRRHYRTRWA
ncbi:MAG TPA: cyclic nucleotide-binding domain-containing protein [Roseiflexaceae bacterium]|nr:cyclic nucleotide-binding domain-containing protein [Roseiflexaceae bacterium]